MSGTGLDVAACPAVDSETLETLSEETVANLLAARYQHLIEEGFEHSPP